MTHKLARSAACVAKTVCSPPLTVLPALLHHPTRPAPLDLGSHVFLGVRPAGYPSLGTMLTADVRPHRAALERARARTSGGMGCRPPPPRRLPASEHLPASPAPRLASAHTAQWLWSCWQPSSPQPLPAFPGWW